MVSRRGSALMLGAVALFQAAQALEPAEHAQIASWWTWVGLSVALLARAPLTRWPALVAALLVVTTAVTWIDGAPVGAAVLTALEGVVASAAGAVVLTDRLRRPSSLQSLLDLCRAVGAALVCGVIAAATLPFVDVGLARVPTAPFDLFAQHSVSTLILIALGLVADRVAVNRPAGTALVLQTVLLWGLIAAVFLPDTTAPVSYAPLPALIWAALAFDISVVVGQLAVFAAAVLSSTAYERGPFGYGASEAAIYDRDWLTPVVLGYLLCCALITLPLAVTVGQKRALQAKSGSDSRLLRRNFTESPMGMLFLRGQNGQLVVDDVNSSAARILNGTRESLAGRALDQVLDTLEPMTPVVVDLVSGRVDSWHGRAVALGRPGSRLDLAVATLDDRDGVHYFSAQLLDVTQEHEAQRRLQEALKLTDTTLDTTACVILVVDSSGRIVRANAATAEITGYTDDDLLGHLVWETPLSSLTRPQTEAMFLWPNRSGSPMLREQRCMAADGSPLLIMWTENVVRDEFGLPTYAVLTGIDVTAERSSTGLMSHLLQASISTSIIGIDTAGRMTFANAGAAHMLGYSTEGMVGMSFADLLDPAELQQLTGVAEGEDALQRLLRNLGEQTESRPIDTSWRTRDGGSVIVSMTLSRTNYDVQERVSFLCVARDVTEQREAQQTLVAAAEKDRTALARLQALDRAKDEFVSTVSHELRTPVTSIVGYTEMLRDGTVVDPSPDQAPMLESIARNGQRLIAVCNDLLLLSGFESEAILGQREPTDLRQCLTAAEDAVGALLATRDLQLTVQTGPEELIVVGDRGQLDRVVINLLSNAIKFTPDGGSVTARVQRLDSRALITVRDSGIGIPPEDHESVFQRFFRTERAQHLAIQGTGLGLSIVASIVDAHAGKIELDSEPGVGTTFRVWLPLSPS
ncbi:MAG: PAS domain S-box protein [Nocardioides sp.]